MAKSRPSPHFFLSNDRARRPRSWSRARSRSAERHFVQPLSTPVRESARMVEAVEALEEERPETEPPEPSERERLGEGVPTPLPHGDVLRGAY